MLAIPAWGRGSRKIKNLWSSLATYEVGRQPGLYETLSHREEGQPKRGPDTSKMHETYKTTEDI